MRVPSGPGPRGNYPAYPPSRRYWKQPLFNVALDYVIRDELHLLLRITDVLLTNLLDDAMERDEKEDNLKSRGMEKGTHINEIVKLIKSCGVTFKIWQKQDTTKGMINMDWTSLIGDEKTNLLKQLPAKLIGTTVGIHENTRSTVAQIWKVSHFGIVLLKC